VAILGLFLRGAAQAFIRPVSYIWYILITAVAGWTLFSGKALDFPATDLLSLIQVFKTGMAFMYLIVLFIDLFYIAELFVSGNREDLHPEEYYGGDRADQSPDPRKVFSEKFLDIPLKEPNKFTLILGLQFVLTCVNYWFNIVSPFLFAYFCLLAMPVLVTAQLTSNPDAAPQQP